MSKLPRIRLYSLELRVEPRNALILRFVCLSCLLLVFLQLAPDAEAVTRTFVHPNLTLRSWQFRLERRLDLLSLLRRDLIVLIADRHRDGHGYSLDVPGNLQPARVAREAGVDERLAILRRVFIRVGEEKYVLAAPAETGRADGQGVAFFLAKLLEEVFHDREGLAKLSVEGEGKVVPERQGKVPATDLSFGN